MSKENQPNKARRYTLKQRLWTTGSRGEKLTVLRTSEDLEQRIESASRQTNVRVREHHWGDSNNLVFYELGVVKQGKKVFPAVSDSYGKWYFLQPSANIELGKIYHGSLADEAKGVSAVGRMLQQQHEMPLPKESSVAVYDRRKPIALEDALSLKLHNMPVYEGATHEFIDGWILKKPNPIHARIGTKKSGAEEVEVVGTIVISLQDYRALADYLFEEKGQPPSKTIEKLVAQQKPSAGKTIRPREGGIERKTEITPEETYEGPRYLSWIQSKKLPGIIAQENSPIAEKALREQYALSQSIPPLEGIEELLRYIRKGDSFKPEYVSAKVTYMHQVPLGKDGKNGNVWLAYIAHPETGIEPDGFYLILPPFNGVVEVLYRNGHIDKVSTVPRAIERGLGYWPHNASALRQVKQSDAWHFGFDCDVVLEGLVAVPENVGEPVVYDGIPLLGVLGMKRTAWANMVARMVANNIWDEYDSNQIPLNYVEEKARSAYTGSGAIKAAYLGGPEKFVNSVLTALKNHGVGITTQPLTPKK